jgi:hypothetical protein
MFGLYRLWIAIIEFRPNWFYNRDITEIPEQYQHVEPTYRLRRDENNKKSEMPIVDLAEGVWWGTLLAALFYLMLAHLVPWLFSLFA